jgi:hypothetical protein
MAMYRVTVIGIEQPFQVEANSDSEAVDKVLSENNLTNVEGDVELI